MKRYTGNEIAALVVASVIFIGGAGLVIFPQAGSVPQDWNIRDVKYGSNVNTLNESKSRLIGMVTMALGISLAGMTSYRKNR